MYSSNIRGGDVCEGVSKRERSTYKAGDRDCLATGTVYRGQRDICHLYAVFDTNYLKMCPALCAGSGHTVRSVAPKTH